MEIWDLYTKDRGITNKTHVRGKPIPEGYYHLVVHVWITDGNNRFLMSKRDASRPTFPLLWECVGGSVLRGENSYQGVIRETIEEVGIDLTDCEGTVFYTKTRINDIMDAWLFTYAGDIDLSLATTNEVCEVKWMTKEDILQLYEKHSLVPTLEYFFEKIAK